MEWTKEQLAASRASMAGRRGKGAPPPAPQKTAERAPEPPVAAPVVIHATPEAAVAAQIAAGFYGEGATVESVIASAAAITRTKSLKATMRAVQGKPDVKATGDSRLDELRSHARAARAAKAAKR